MKGSMESPPVRTSRLKKELMRTGPHLRVLLADDHPLLRQSMRLLLESRAEVDIVGEASDGLEAAELAVALRPDMVLMDVDMPNLNGIEATVQIRRRAPGVQVIMLSNYAGRNSQGVHGQSRPREYSGVNQAFRHPVSEKRGRNPDPWAPKAHGCQKLPNLSA